MLVLTEADNKLGAAVDRTLQYYALFSYPLRVEEIRRQCSIACTDEEVRACLEEAGDKVFNYEGFYSTSAEIAAQVARRLRGAEKAARDLGRAARIGRLIYQCPFVRFVGISGSLSKGYSDDRADFDFFIVTQTDRLWISRTMLHLFKKLTFLVRQQHKFCMNYFLDEGALKLEEENVFTATELSSMIPVCGAALYDRLMIANSWIDRFLPNRVERPASRIHDSNGLLKRAVAGLLNYLDPTGLNHFLMRLTDRKWRKKWAVKGYPLEDYDLAFKTTLHISKNHPANYQKRILEALTEKDR